MKIISLFTLYFLVISVSYAVQPESPVACNEGVEPLQLSYGDHTTGCAFDAVTDVDQFSFIGSAGDEVRIIVSSVFDVSDPIVEVRDPDGTVIAEQTCAQGCSFVIDLALTVSGTYSVIVQEDPFNETGVYQLNLQCLFGPCPPNFASALIQVTPTLGLSTNENGGTG